MLETGLNTKQLHYCDKFNKITPSGKSSTGGGVKTRYYGIIFFCIIIPNNNLSNRTILLFNNYIN